MLRRTKQEVLKELPPKRRLVQEIDWEPNPNGGRPIMVEKGKPAPDIYSYACETLEVNPSQTFAVEDSPNGCLSAYRAGCNVIMIPDLTEPDAELSKILYARLESLIDIKTLFSS